MIGLFPLSKFTSPGYPVWFIFAELLHTFELDVVQVLVDGVFSCIDSDCTTSRTVGPDIPRRPVTSQIHNTGTAAPRPLQRHILTVNSCNIVVTATVSVLLTTVPGKVGSKTILTLSIPQAFLF